MGVCIIKQIMTVINSGSYCVYLGHQNVTDNNSQQTLAYYDTKLILAIIGFMLQAPGLNFQP